MAYLKFSLSEKQDILCESAEQGVLPTARKYQ